MIITPNIQNASQALCAVGEDTEMGDSADSSMDQEKPAVAPESKRKRSIIQKFNDEIGNICDAIAELECCVDKLHKKAPLVQTVSTSGAIASISRSVAGSRAMSIPHPGPILPSVVIGHQDSPAPTLNYVVCDLI
ncbi:hypothetical protein CVT25_009390 [Psilocybe cyanescens]|uniref:Uncharacterized protein n=1 Tax=Psilocybe cyanescens TaxID=93625 RepID=A0A409XV01_PSICY|nr:hypothetical protein CVT25_009390 [Psilocybe cyanescens]